MPRDPIVSHLTPRALPIPIPILKPGKMFPMPGSRPYCVARSTRQRSSFIAVRSVHR